MFYVLKILTFLFRWNFEDISKLDNNQQSHISNANDYLNANKIIMSEQGFGKILMKQSNFQITKAI